MQTPISSPAKACENPAGSEGWNSDCLSSRLTLDAVLLHVLFRGAELRQASSAPDSLRGSPTAYLQFALSGVVRSLTLQLPGALAPLLRAQEAEPPGIGEHAVAACRQVCQRTNVPKNRCAVAVSSRTAPLGKRHWAAPLSGDSTALPASPGGPLPSTRNSGKPKGMDLIGAVFMESYP